jgi:flagellar hook-associated protein 3 FlgL
MISGISASAERFLADLERIQQRLSKAEREVSSGRTVSAPSDDPDQVGSILQYSLELDRVVQIQTNLVRFGGEVNVAEQAVESAMKALDRARAIAVEGASTLTSTEQRAVLAAEVETLLQRLVAGANLTYEGRYVFSGGADGTPPYQLDLGSPNGVTPYAGSQATKQAEHPSGTVFVVSRSAQEIFDSAGASVFGSVNALRQALVADDPQAVAAARDLVVSAQQHLSEEQGFYGGVQRQMADASGFAKKLELRLRVTLGELRDTDLSEALVAMNEAGSAQQAALLARANLPRTSLFDFLG